MDTTMVAPFQNPMTQPLYPAGSREARAEALIADGKVHLTIGQRFAIVDGSHGEQYRVSRDGCECVDYQRNGGPCKHQISVRWLCDAYRSMTLRAKRHGRTRLPAALGRALRPVSFPSNVTPIRSKVAA